MNQTAQATISAVVTLTICLFLLSSIVAYAAPISPASCANLKALVEADCTADYELQNDLDCTGEAGVTSSCSVAPGYTGVLDGEGHTITGLLINQPAVDRVGLFSRGNGTIKNLRLLKSNIIGDWYVGGLMGFGSNLIVENSSFTGNVTGAWTVGGLIGSGYYSNIDNCFTNVNISNSGTNTGGLIGDGRDSIVNNSYVLGDVNGTGTGVGGLMGYGARTRMDNSYATCDVWGDSFYVGGLVGNARYATLTNTSSSGTIISDTDHVGGLVGLGAFSNISDSYNTGDITGYRYVGGIAGTGGNLINSSNSSGTITGANIMGGLAGHMGSGTIINSHVTGDVTGLYSVGGLAGYASVIRDSYAICNVVGAGNVGGLSGDHASIYNSYHVGNITATVFTTTYDVGGLASLNLYNNVVLENSFYDVNNSLINKRPVITPGAVFNNQYTDWINNNLSLNISDYFSADGSGYYIINNISDLKNVLGFAWDSNYKFRLNTSLNLENETNFYVPYINSKFDGDNNTISNLNINLENITGVGFFGIAKNNNAIGNLSLMDVNVLGKWYVGGLFGFRQNSKINNSYVTGTINGSMYTGGLAGYLRDLEVDNSYVKGHVIGRGTLVGGLVGRSYDVDINESYVRVNVTGDDYAACFISKAHYTNIDNSYLSCNLTGVDVLGGFAAEVYYSSVDNSYAKINITGGSYVGGWAGLSWGNSIDTMFVTGSINGSNYLGGLVGYGDNDEINNSYWNNHTDSPDSCLAGGTPTSITCTAIDDNESYFYDVSNSPLDVWNWTDIWCNESNGVDYPGLQWEGPCNFSVSSQAPVPAPPQGGGSSCSQDWECTDWSDCVSGTQTRTCDCDCADDDDCDGNNDEEQSCTEEESDSGDSSGDSTSGTPVTPTSPPSPPLPSPEQPDKATPQIDVEGEPELGEEVDVVVTDPQGQPAKGEVEVKSPTGTKAKLTLSNGRVPLVLESSGQWTFTYTDSEGNTVSETITVGSSPQGSEEIESEVLEEETSTPQPIKKQTSGDMNWVWILLLLISICLILFLVKKRKQNKNNFYNPTINNN